MNIFKNYPKDDTPLDQIPWYWRMGNTEALVLFPLLIIGGIYALFFGG